MSALDRRETLRLIGLGAAAALAGCDAPQETIHPAAHPAEGEVPGVVRRYRTALPFCGYGRGVTGLVVDGRPIKLEGAPDHPASLGATDLFTEVAILDLYDPQRLRAPVERGVQTSWERVAQEIAAPMSRNGGEGFRLLTGRITSPTLLRRIGDLKRRFPGMRHVRYEAIDDDAESAGAALAFGRPLTMRPRLAEADIVVALDADPLGPGPDQIPLARGWSERRKRPGAAPRLYALEPTLTQTGVVADRRATEAPAAIAAAARAILAGLSGGQAGDGAPPIVAHILRDLRAAKGRAVVVVGRAQPPEIHAVAAAINERLAAPVDWIAPVDPETAPHRQALRALRDEIESGKVTTLVMIDVNPVLHAPGFAKALERVSHTVAVSAFEDETARAARWTLPLSHPLEAWGDLRATDGTASIVQPLIRPLYDTRSPVEIVDLLEGRIRQGSNYDAVRETWAQGRGDDFDAWWTRALVAGVVTGSASSSERPGPATPPPHPPIEAGHEGLVVRVAPSPTVWDGRIATNAWAQECPDPVTKEVWGSSLRLSHTDASRLGLADGDVVRLGEAGEAAVRIARGQAEGLATLLMGYGRDTGGPIADVGGANAFALLPQDGWTSAPITLARSGENRNVVSTQSTFELEGELAKLFPILAPGEAMETPKLIESLLKVESSPAPAAWGMVIDTSVCIGCNACVVACQAENNIPAIGPDEMARNRDMHWLRVDFYDRGTEAEPAPGFQPVPCMHCETAPCEPVCPVAASVHDTQGLNLQVYNRCVGTRTCQANCPYKVRRFNFLDYADHGPYGGVDQKPLQGQRNPNVTVRARGVMEKCTYCVQRISAANRASAATGDGIEDGAVVTACQSACPTRAITFGNLRDEGSAVAKLKRDPRHFALLEELGTRPRTTYLARVRNSAEGGS
jgi:molybdopterin-containing oxidoreductase family iron-sulfur binding subunit